VRISGINLPVNEQQVTGKAETESLSRGSQELELLNTNLVVSERLAPAENLVLLPVGTTLRLQWHPSRHLCLAQSIRQDWFTLTKLHQRSRLSSRRLSSGRVVLTSQSRVLQCSVCLSWLVVVVCQPDGLLHLAHTSNIFIS
jgi:hypothetical protein